VLPTLKFLAGRTEKRITLGRSRDVILGHDVFYRGKESASPRAKARAVNWSRRELCLALPAALAAVSAAAAAEKERLTSKVYPFDKLREQKSGKNGFWPVLDGLTHEGVPLEVHETELAPGSMPHPPHRHGHEEMFLIREGAPTLTINGKSARLGPGSVGFVASNDLHGIRNSGSAPARYFVIAIGHDK
jgi:mannose-6-phosphate isomerase-like protein (cupin superfamily)